MSRYIDLIYFKENFGDDQDFILELMKSSKQEFLATIEKLQPIQTEKDFDSDILYDIIHKFKPISIIYNIDSKKYFEKYGKADNKLNFSDFMEIKDSILQNLNNAYDELEELINKS